MPSITERLNEVTLGQPAIFENLAVFPLLASQDRTPDYQTLDEALEAKSVRITEVSAGGSVPELKLENRGAQPVLLLDGEELVGAKQNRVLNLTVLAPAGKTTVIPVSCVEAGRWSQQTVEFAAAARTQFAEARRKKMARVSESLAACGERRSDQGEVWADIADKARRLQARSSTAAMAAVFEKHAARLEDYVKAFHAGPGQHGALFAINGVVTGFDLFDCSATLGKLLPKLIRSTALDAIDHWSTSPPAPSSRDAEALLHTAGAVSVASFAAVGLGEDLRLNAAGFTGSGLMVGERLIHLAGFVLEQADRDSATGGRYLETSLARASARRTIRTRQGSGANQA